MSAMHCACQHSRAEIQAIAAASCESQPRICRDRSERQRNVNGTVEYGIEIVTIEPIGSSVANPILDVSSFSDAHFYDRRIIPR